MRNKLLGLLLCFSGVAQAQSNDSVLVKRTDLHLDSTRTALDKYCQRGNALVSVCKTKVNVAIAKSSTDSVLTNKTDTIRIGKVDTVFKHDTVLVVRVDTVIVSDTTKPPIPPPTGGFDGVAELPRLTPSIVNPSCSTTVAVVQGADLQQALNAIQPGSCLLLAAGATFTGNFILPNKNSTSWVTIVTQAALPATGTRMTPTTANSLRLAKILSPNYSAALTLAQGAGYYRLRGLEIATTPAAQTSGMNVLFDIRNTSSTFSIATAVKFIQVEQSWIHGTPTLDMRRCIWLDSYMSSVIDSWVEDCHSNNTDSQAGLHLSGAKGILWQNNYLEAGHEILMWGGGDPPDSTLQPSDVTVRRNHITRPASWKGVWQIKNLIETKNLRRMLFESNVIENSWPDAQAGFCFVMKGENQNGTAPWSTSADMTIRYNKINRCAEGFNISGRGTAGVTALPSSRFSIHDNYVDSLAKYGGQGIAMQSLNDINKENYTRNTFMNGLQGLPSNQAISFDGPAAVEAVWDGNIMGRGTYGVKGSGTADGMSTLNTYAPGSIFNRNAIVGGGGCTQYPAGNSCPSTAPASTSTTGADVTLLNQLTATVVVTDTLSRRRSTPRQSQLKYKYHPSPERCHTINHGALENLKCDVPLKR
jgi:hypothetical protein